MWRLVEKVHQGVIKTGFVSGKTILSIELEGGQQ